MCALGKSMIDKEVELPLPQEPFAVSESIRGLPWFIRVFPSVGAEVAVAFNVVNVECMVI